MQLIEITRCHIAVLGSTLLQSLRVQNPDTEVCIGTSAHGCHARIGRTGGPLARGRASPAALAGQLDAVLIALSLPSTPKGHPTMI
jgi:hypothetical protein